MESVQSVMGRLPFGRRLLSHGESAVFFPGMAIAGILLSVVVTAAVWSATALRTALEEGRARQVRGVGALLSESSEMMLGAEELTALRRMVLEAGREHQLKQCRVVLTDGRVAADIDPLRITLHELPPTWVQGAPKPRQDTLREGQITLVYPLMVPGRGGGRLEIVAEVSYPFLVCWQAQTGIGAIGIAGLLALLLVYRDMRSRLRAVGAIREALLASIGGEDTKDALAVNVDLGIEAKAWNKILDERETLSKRMVADRAKDLLGAGREPNGELGAACDAMSQGLVLVDNQMKVKYANGAAAVFLHADRDTMVGKDISELVLEEEVVSAIRSVACGSTRRRTSVEIQRSGETGAVVLRVSVRPVRREDFAAGMIVIEDVTQQRVADQARNAFVAQATHELRTPLTNIRLYVETAIDEGEKDPSIRANCLNVINQEAHRLERMVGDILSVAEIEAGSLKIKKDDIRLDALFAELEADYQAHAEEKDIELTFSLPPKLPVIQGDREKLALAIHNLLGNALKYTLSGGKVSLAAEASNDGLAVEVKDTGIGIGEADRAKIFEKFYRASDSRVTDVTGSGLGLALAREVVRLHGGDITVDSQVDKGSTFTLTLPIHVEVA